MSQVTRETLTLNMGPQHPSMHGVLRLILQLEGEVVVGCEPVIGYLHTGIEKQMETRTYHQNITLVDRIEYLAAFHEEFAYCMAVEKLLDIEVPPRAQAIRVIMSELTRVASHLVYLATSALELNVSSVYMYCFSDREEILSLFEEVSGQRMMPGYFRIGGLQWDLPEGFIERARTLADLLERHQEEYEALLTNNLIWRQRYESVGVISAADALAYG
ncbi:MAG: NADH-quinone oxidoreductase subunit D, partial [Armatimonadetes bacterium]|nr:NADH-quinone oxidoreductase subunit D [Armatimonadota bacterium]